MSCALAIADDKTQGSDVSELALVSDIGTTRTNNEDACGWTSEAPGCTVFAVADGVGGYEGGEVASRMAIDVTLERYSDSPAEWGAAKRIYRAVQAANIEIHNHALRVAELRWMATTLTAAVVENGILSATHVGDCRLYLIRAGRISHITRDHTMVGEQVRMGLMSEAAARTHPERSMLLRSLGRELIVSIGRISMPLYRDDVVILCSDGLYSVLEDAEILKLSVNRSAQDACRMFIDKANERGTPDNLTVAFYRQLEAPTRRPPGWRTRLQGIFSRRR